MDSDALRPVLGFALGVVISMHGLHSTPVQSWSHQYKRVSTLSAPCTAGPTHVTMKIAQAGPVVGPGPAAQPLPPLSAPRDTAQPSATDATLPEAVAPPPAAPDASLNSKVVQPVLDSTSLEPVVVPPTPSIPYVPPPPEAPGAIIKRTQRELRRTASSN